MSKRSTILAAACSAILLAAAGGCQSETTTPGTQAGGVPGQMQRNKSMGDFMKSEQAHKSPEK